MAIVSAAVPVASWSTFDYWAPEGAGIDRGAIVRVPLGRRSVIGVVVGVPATSTIAPEKLHAIEERVPSLPALPPDLLELGKFVSRYYQQPLGMVLAQMVPPLGPAGRERSAEASAWILTESGRAAFAGRLPRYGAQTRAVLESWLAAPDGVLDAPTYAAMAPVLKRTLRGWLREGLIAASPSAPAAGGEVARPYALNERQRNAVDRISGARGFAPFLLHGVTGSGKTEVYLTAASAAIDRGGQVLLLVPEINLTPQLEQRLRAALPRRRIATLHSRLAAGERRRAFCEAAAGHADLVVGTRLAVFAPLPRLELIVVDEEHDASFKQQDNVRYHARDVAVWRARQRAIPVVLGSATPALETLLQARNGRYARLDLPARAVLPARMPEILFEPARAEGTREGLGPALVQGIAARLERGEQSLVFINRRGFAPTLLCVACGWYAECPHCSARLVVHRDAGALRCHHCGHSRALPRACCACGNVDLAPIGHGTQRLEHTLRALFPSARIARVDRDTTARKGAFAAVRDAIHAGSVDILVGTQMLAKGHDFPRLTLVGVLGADNALYSADFRATERLGALLFQVAGRAGRAQHPGEVIVATDFANHALYQALAAHDYERLADVLLADRRVAGLPPYGHLAMVAAEAPQRASVEAFLEQVSTLGRTHASALRVPVQVFAPVPAGLARRAGMERAQVLAQSHQRAALQRFLPAWRESIDALSAHRVRWAIDVDPLSVS